MPWRTRATGDPIACPGTAVMGVLPPPEGALHPADEVRTAVATPVPRRVAGGHTRTPCSCGGLIQQASRGHAMREDHTNLKEDASMRTRLIVGLTIMSIWFLGGQMLAAQDTHGKADAALMKALQGVKVSLVDGLTASEQDGTPISGKFELEEGKLQLSVYTMKGDTFSEVIVDHTAGKVTKVEPITSGKDLTDATAQRAAMTKATKNLRAAVTAALTAHPGAQAVSVTPKVQGGKAVAEVTLVEKGAMTTVSEPLG